MFGSARKNIESAMFACIAADLNDELQNYLRGIGCENEPLSARGNVNATRSYTFEDEKIEDESLTHFAIRAEKPDALRILLATGQVDLRHVATYYEERPVTAYEYLQELIRADRHKRNPTLIKCLEVFNAHLEALKRLSQTPSRSRMSTKSPT